MVRVIRPGAVVALVLGGTLGFAGCGSDDEESSNGGGGGSGASDASVAGGSGGASFGGGGSTPTGGGSGGAIGGSAGSAGSAGGSAGASSPASCTNAIDYLANRDPNTGTVTGVIDPAGDADFYVLDLAADEYYVLATDANPDDNPGEVDTVINLYTADGSTLLATADDSVPRYSTDSELVYHSPVAQTVCVKIEEWSTWAGQPPVGDPSFVYDFGVLQPDMGQPANNEDMEPNNNSASAQPITFENVASTASTATFGFLFGSFADEADVDVYAYSMPAGNVSSLIYFVPPGPGGPGQHGSGSTVGLGLVQFTDSAGQVIASVDAAKGAGTIHPPIAQGTDVLLWIHRESGSVAGANDFYTFTQYNFDDEALEAEIDAGQNDVLADAETLSNQPSQADPSTSASYVLGFIQAAGDVDYFGFHADANDRVDMACAAIRSGSGLIAPTFAIHDATDVALQSETESDAADLRWSDAPYGDPSLPAVSISTSGTHYLVVSAQGQNPDVSGSYYRCGLYVISP